MKYKIKVDLWVRLILYIVALMYIPMMFFAPEDEMYIFILLTLGTALLILPLFMSYYELTDDALVISIYFFKKRIKYDNIKTLRLCQNWLSSSAMSKDRIEIKEHNKGKLTGTTYISPVHREDFFSDLKRYCMNLDLTPDKDIFELMEK